MRLVYVQALAYCGSAEVLKVRKDGRYLIETPSGRTHRVRASDCRDLRAERAPSPPALELVPNVGGEPRAVPKPAPPERVPAYLAWLRTIECCRCGRSDGIEASHHVAKGDGTMGRKTSDLRALPCCFRCHRLYHSDPAKFGDRDWIDDEIAKHTRRWVRSLGNDPE